MLVFRGVHPGKINLEPQQFTFGEDDFPLQILVIFLFHPFIFRGVASITGELLLVYCLVFGKLICIAGNHPTLDFSIPL